MNDESLKRFNQQIVCHRITPNTRCCSIGLNELTDMLVLLEVFRIGVGLLIETLFVRSHTGLPEEIVKHGATQDCRRNELQTAKSS